MGKNSAIEWTDHTYNPWMGCAKVHEGCAHCYAEQMMATRLGRVVWGDGPTATRRVTKSFWKPPKYAAGDRVFCASLADVFEAFHGWVLDYDGSALVFCRSCWELRRAGTEPLTPHCGTCKSGLVRHANLTDLRQVVARLWRATPDVTWLVLTKRPANVPLMLPSYDDGYDNCYPNVMFGTSISLQKHVGMVDDLRTAKSLCGGLFLSCEPLLGPLDLDLDGIDWVIVGGESGPAARPMRVEWVRSIRDQCVKAGVPFFFKQWGEWCDVEQMPDGTFAELDAAVNLAGHGQREWRVGKHRSGALLDVVEYKEFPTLGERE